MGALSRSFLWGLVGLENSTVSGWLIDLGVEIIAVGASAGADPFSEVGLTP